MQTLKIHPRSTESETLEGGGPSKLVLQEILTVLQAHLGLIISDLQNKDTEQDWKTAKTESRDQEQR